MRPDYAHFLEHAKPLFLPTAKIGWIVTSRLERYRPQTEAWLAQHEIQYGQLIMRDLPSKKARVRAESHASYKAMVYKRLKTRIFMERAPLKITS